ncbi:Cysteine/Histidine-rich C1 domain family protein [Raphanus sativus]|nr:Cysteine/Histidine-rich C1 domain family protein [Raphanus sativus]
MDVHGQSVQLTSLRRRVYIGAHLYRCQECEEFFIHIDCLDHFHEAYHTFHPQHPLKSLDKSYGGEVPDYADKNCLLCGKNLNLVHQLHHCDVCNVSICRECMRNPPPVDVDCLKTHEHQLHLVPRLIDFTCNACGTQGSRSPYFCLPCNFMIHRECIDLPRVININRHDHRISYTPRLGHGEWKCRVCRKKVDGFYGAYTCAKCPSFSVHARCATRSDVWDMVEREGTPDEEEEIAPYEVIDDNTIRHFSHDHHNLQFNKDEMILSENTLCKACVFQIGEEPFYICKQQECDFILHEKCANLPRKKRHVRNNLPFTLRADSHSYFRGVTCDQYSTGFRYESVNSVPIDVRCASISDSLDHESHPHPLYYYNWAIDYRKSCSRCGKVDTIYFYCDECEDYKVDGKCAMLPKKVLRNRYDDHPLFLSYEDMNVDEKYWCEACETKVDSKRGFYTCNDCGVILHISCALGDFSYIMPGSFISVNFDFGYIYIREGSMTSSNEEVVSNTSICRPLCAVCNSRCKLPSVLKLSKSGGVVLYFCSLTCREHFGRNQ